jgi:hypothetical protein
LAAFDDSEQDELALGIALRVSACSARLEGTELSKVKHKKPRKPETATPRKARSLGSNITQQTQPQET